MVVFSHSKATRSVTEVGPRGGGRKWGFKSLPVFFLLMPISIERYLSMEIQCFMGEK